MSDTREPTTVTTLYCAGKMRGEPAMGFPKFDEAADQLRRAGYRVVNPADLDRGEPTPAGDLDRADCLRRDLIHIIYHCDGIALLPGWSDSSGACMEQRVAVELGLPTQSVDTWLEDAAKSRRQPPGLVGFTGYAGAGKDEAARALVDRLGYTRIAFADALKDMLYRVDPLADWDPVLSVQCSVDLHGWDEAKSRDPETRELLQRLGVAAREVIDEDVWVNLALTRADDVIGDCGAVVIPDVRFDNEVEAIRNEGGVIVHINRPGYGPANDHESEQLASRPIEFADAVIGNVGTLDALHDAAVGTVLGLGEDG